MTVAMGRRAIHGNALVLLAITVGAVIAAAVTAPLIANAFPDMRIIKVRLTVPKQVRAMVMNELNNATLKSRAIKTAFKNPEVKELISDGYRVANVTPILRVTGGGLTTNGTLKIGKVEVVGAILSLSKKGSNQVYVTVYFNTGTVLIGRARISTG